MVLMYHFGKDVFPSKCTAQKNRPLGGEHLSDKRVALKAAELLAEKEIKEEAATAREKRRASHPLPFDEMWSIARTYDTLFNNQYKFYDSPQKRTRATSDLRDIIKNYPQSFEKEQLEDLKRIFADSSKVLEKKLCYGRKQKQKLKNLKARIKIL